MDTAVVIENGAPLPDSWIAQPNVLVVSQLKGESYAEFLRRLRRRLAYHARDHVLKRVRYYAASREDTTRVRRFRLIALRSLLRPLRRSAEMHLFVPASDSQPSLFGLIDRLRDFAMLARINIRLTFLPGPWRSAAFSNG